MEQNSKKKILKWLEFTDEVKNLDIYKRLEDKQGTYDIAHLRRDDISNANYNKNNPQAYSVVSKQSYLKAFHDLNNLIYENKEHNFTLIGLDQLGKSKPSTLFFLSKNGFMGNNVKFTMSSEIPKLWKNCDLWITDNKTVIDHCPKNKKVVKFNTDYNQHFTNQLEIHKLTEIDKTWLKSSENIIISTLAKLLRRAN